jgi:hypothetical protein
LRRGDILGLYFNSSNRGFKQSVNSQIYVDKTGLIEYTNHVLDTEQKFICISRPRRFGKSMAAKMLNAYYCCSCDSKDVFDRLKISSAQGYQEHLNKYNTIFINIQDFLSVGKDVKGLLDLLQKRVIADIKKEFPNMVFADGDELAFIMASVFDETNNPFIIIIDEWDCVFREYAEDTDGQRLYLDFLRNLLKDKDYISLAYMTGILPIKKYGTHSALNMFDEFSMIEPGKLAEFVGFTEDEVKSLCSEYGMSFDDTKEWYDGYSFRCERSVYSPKSVVSAMLNRHFDNYWTQTETYEALKVYINMNFEGLKDCITNLLSGGSYKIDPYTFTNDMTTIHNIDNVLTLLVHLGYLAYNSEIQEVYIPNTEIEKQFISTINMLDWKEVTAALQNSVKLLDETIDMNADYVADAIDSIHRENTSILKYNDENSLACVISLAYYSAKAYYNIYRELPAGNGFADIAFIPKKHIDKPAIIVELKYGKSAEEAINQIKHRQYAGALADYKGNVLLVGINYDKETKKHSCIIEKDC